MSRSVTPTGVRVARDRFDESAVVGRTPTDTSRTLGDMSGADVCLKMEHLQRTGSFKMGGTYSRLRRVADSAETVSRVVLASAGNHAQGVAFAASTVGFETTIVMPTNAPGAKVNATRDYGATVELRGTYFTQAMEYASSLAADDDVLFVHAYDDPDIVAGQGTIGLEICEQRPSVDTVVVPVGGGGLIGGVATALSGVDPSIRVIGVQAEAAAAVPDSLQKGRSVDIDATETIADGIATGGISALTYGFIEQHVDRIVTVSDDEIANAVLLLLERAKQLVDGAGAAAIAGLLSGQIEDEGETVVPVLAGGNIDMSMLQTVLTHALTERRQLLRLRIRIRDESGRVAEISRTIAEEDGNT